MIRWVLQWLFPPKCVLCRAILAEEETDLCHCCRVSQPEYRDGGRKLSHIVRMTALWGYEGHVRESLRRYKFAGARSYAASYGRLLAMGVQKELPVPDVITWVPVSAKRRRKRGYDQSELLALAVAEELGIPAERLLDKFRDNPPNSTLKTQPERRANVQGVYKAVKPERIRGRRVLLLDDIVTTGATASECARVLKTAGAEEIIFAALAVAGNPSNK